MKVPPYPLFTAFLHYSVLPQPSRKAWGLTAIAQSIQPSLIGSRLIQLQPDGVLFLSSVATYGFVSISPDTQNPASLLFHNEHSCREGTIPIQTGLVDGQAEPLAGPEGRTRHPSALTNKSTMLKPERCTE